MEDHTLRSEEEHAESVDRLVQLFEENRKAYEALQKADRGRRGDKSFRTRMLTIAASTAGRSDDEVGLTDEEYRVLSVIAWAGDSDGGNSFPGVATIAEGLGRSVQQVRNHLRSIQRKGWLKRVECYRANGSRTSSLYVFKIPRKVLRDGEMYPSEKRQGAYHWSKMRNDHMPRPQRGRKAKSTTKKTRS